MNFINFDNYLFKNFLKNIRSKVEMFLLQLEEGSFQTFDDLKKYIHTVLPDLFLFNLLDSQQKQISEFFNLLYRINLITSEMILNLISKNSERFVKNLIDLLDYRIHWDEFPIDYKPDNTLPLFISAREAVSLIPNESVVYSSGFAANGRCSIFFRALSEHFKEKGYPNQLTWISVSAQGGRGKAPGTIEELAEPGLLKEYICGHLETAKKLLELGEKGFLELHTMPQGELSFLIESQKNGIYSILSDTGRGTFLDPEIGNGSCVTDSNKSYIRVNGDMLEYSLPPIQVALISVPYADVEGNLYLDKSAVITEIYDAVDAAKHNKGIVIAAVSEIIPVNKSRISISSKKIDYVVVNPKNEQVGGVKQRNYWKTFLPKKIQEQEGGIEDIDFSISMIKIINNILGITPYRKEVDNIIARLATYVFVQNVYKNSIVNIGIGLPEEVSRLLYESGLYQDLIFTTESGVYGGLPVSGIFFGASINPDAIYQSSWMFHQYDKRLDVSVLGMLEVDSEGNVNVSEKGPSIKEFVGPGGFPNISKNAKLIIFVGPFMWKSKMIITSEGLKIQKRGKSKFVRRVSQITFNARNALKNQKKVYYITDVGIFQLTEKGIMLTDILPGIDVFKDILENSEANILISQNLKTLDISFVTGQNFNFGSLKEKNLQSRSKNQNKTLEKILN